MIVRNRNFNYVDASGKEYFDKEMANFPVLATEEDINNYAEKRIDIHWHNQYEFFYLIKGKALVSVNGKDYQINEKEACYIGPNSLHGVKPIKGYACLYRSLVIHSNIISGSSGSIFDIKVNKNLQAFNDFYKIDNKQENTLFFKNFQDVWNALDKENHNYEFVVRNGLSNIYIFLDSLEDAKNKDSKINISVLKEILEWIEDKPEKIKTITMISQYIHLSPREIQRIFAHNLNCSPMEYIRRKRIMKSTEELLYSDMPIIDIAYQYGFSSPAHYSLIFKKVMGYKPTEYRKLYRSGFNK